MTQVTRPGPQRETARYNRIRISVTKGPDLGLCREGAGQTFTIGTSEECQLTLSDDTVSRRHCEIALMETGFRVVDCGSTNGVRCGSTRVFEIESDAPLDLVLGETTISVTPLAESEARDRFVGHRYYDLVGRSAKMRELFARLDVFAKTNMSLLIEGETGTGKDVVAESIHRASPRAEGPFVVFDCGAVSENLIESEIFGHDRGAFTGAVGVRVGVFEEADKGTLFLDEIGELPLDLQRKLLRVLEKREVKKLGGRLTKSVDVRVLAATNRDLHCEVQRGNFREDLYYRIAGERIRVPPLRERKDDIPLLIEHFVKLDAPGVSLAHVPPEVWDMFTSHRWPGNVRELRNAVQRLVVAPEYALMRADATGVGPNPGNESSAAVMLEPLRLARSQSVDAFERGYVRALLERSQGKVKQAAAIAEVSRTAIQKLMTKHGIKATD